MKKLAMLLTLPTILAACDSKPKAEFLFSACCDAEKYGVMKLSVWDNKKMVLNINGEDILLKSEEKTESAPSTVYWLNMDGIVPSTKEKISVSVNYDAEKKLLGNISFRINDQGYSTDSYVSVDLKGYRMPNATEQCIEDIDRLVFVSDDNNGIFVNQHVNKWDSRQMQSLHLDPEQDVWEIKIPTEDAMAISKNWDPKNFKTYLNSDKSPTVEEHEKDACDVLARLKTYMADKGYDKPVDIYLDEVGCDKPSKVIKLGANQVRSAGYTAYVLNLCENGKHYLQDVSSGWMFNRLEEKSEWIPVQEQKRDGNIVYSTYNTFRYRLMDIVYSSDTDEYVFHFVDGTVARLDMLNDFQEVNACAYEIYNMSRVNGGVIEVVIDSEIKKENGELKIHQEFVPLTQEQALAISKNWDYKNMKLYHTGEQPHEADACEVYERLESYAWRLKREKKNTENKE